MIERVILAFGGVTLAAYGVIELSLAFVCAWLTIRKSGPIERGS